MLSHKPAQQLSGQIPLPSTGAVTLTDSYRMEVGDSDLYDGTMYGEILLHRSFMYESTPTAAHNYNVRSRLKNHLTVHLTGQKQ